MHKLENLQKIRVHLLGYIINHYFISRGCYEVSKGRSGGVFYTFRRF